MITFVMFFNYFICNYYDKDFLVITNSMFIDPLLSLCQV